MSHDIDDQLRNIYENLTSRGGLGSKAKFYAEVKRQFPNNKQALSRAEKVLRQLPSYGRFFRHRWHFLRRAVTANQVNEIWQVCIPFISKFAPISKFHTVLRIKKHQHQY